MKKIKYVFLVFVMLVTFGCTNQTSTVENPNSKIPEKYVGIIGDKKVYIAYIGLERISVMDGIGKVVEEGGWGNKEEFLRAEDIEENSILIISVCYGKAMVEYEVTKEEEIQRGAELALLGKNISVFVIVTPRKTFYEDGRIDYWEQEIMMSMQMLKGIDAYIYIEEKKSPYFTPMIEKIVHSYDPTIDFLHYGSEKELRNEFIVPLN